jgi:hypothetical protein
VPVTSLVSSLTGTLSSASGGSGSPLAPVTGLLSSVTGTLGSATASATRSTTTTAAPSLVSGLSSTSGSGAAGSLLSPVTSLVGGLLGGIAKK